MAKPWITNAVDTSRAPFLRGILTSPCLMPAFRSKMPIRRHRNCGNAWMTPQRETRAHLSRFDRTWRLQSFPLPEADREGIPILENDSKEMVTNVIMATQIDTLSRDFDQRPDQVFTPPREY